MSLVLSEGPQLHIHGSVLGAIVSQVGVDAAPAILTQQKTPAADKVFMREAWLKAATELREFQRYRKAHPIGYSDLHPKFRHEHKPRIDSVKRVEPYLRQIAPGSQSKLEWMLTQGVKGGGSSAYNDALNPRTPNSGRRVNTAGMSEEPKFAALERSEHRTAASTEPSKGGLSRLQCSGDDRYGKGVKGDRSSRDYRGDAMQTYRNRLAAKISYRCDFCGESFWTRRRSAQDEKVFCCGNHRKDYHRKHKKETK